MTPANGKNVTEYDVGIVGIVMLHECTDFHTCT